MGDQFIVHFPYLHEDRIKRLSKRCESLMF